MRTLVMVSGLGSNLRAILEASDAGKCDAQVVAVISDRPQAAALEYASRRGIATRVVAPRDFDSRADWDEAIADAAAEHAPELVVLAGFMRVFGTPMIDRFHGRIVNVHPSLLPAFPGKDGPGMAIEAGVCITGCTVHLVNHGVDTGPVLAQAAVPVVPGEDRDALHARIQKAEHALFPKVVHAIAQGRIQLDDRPRFDTSNWPDPPQPLIWPQLP